MSKTIRFEPGPTPAGHDYHARPLTARPIANSPQKPLPSRPKAPTVKPKPITASPENPLPSKPKTLNQPSKQLPLRPLLPASNLNTNPNRTTKARNQRKLKLSQPTKKKTKPAATATSAALTTQNLAFLPAGPSNIFTYLYHSSDSERVALGLPRWNGGRDVIGILGVWEGVWDEFC